MKSFTTLTRCNFVVRVFYRIAAKNMAHNTKSLKRRVLETYAVECQQIIELKSGLPYQIGVESIWNSFKIRSIRKFAI